MAVVVAQEAFTYDDVILSPRFSNVQSRRQVSLKTSINGLSLELPIIAANMDTISGIEMFTAMTAKGIGGFAYLHRFTTLEERLAWAKAGLPVTIGVGTNELLFIKDAIAAGARHFLIDIAHGDSQHVLAMIRLVRDSVEDRSELTIVAGNVATPEAAWRLYDAGANVIKVGVGPGAVCTTRSVTGHGFPQLSAILNIKESIENRVSIIADGGIKTSGDIVKALAAGADAVMIGGLLAGTDETPGAVIDTPDGKFKVYRGMASKEAYNDNPNRTSSHIAAEGINTTVPYAGPVANVVLELAAGVRSGLSYSGASNLRILRDNAVFQRISSGTRLENSTRL